MQTVKLTLPIPHEKQAQFLDSPAKRKIIVAGRRGGKTTVMAMMAIDALLKGRRVLEAAPVADQTGAFWDAVTDFAAPLIDTGHIHKWDTTRTLEMPLTGGRIRCKTAHNADTLRGDYADLLLLDEFSYMDADAWTKVGVPMLLDNDGDAVFIFTPNGRNHAYHLYNRAKADDTGRWAAWHFVSSDNPYLSTEALSELTAEMPERAYQQEILAMFLEDGAGVFRRVMDAATAPPQDGAHLGHEYAFGVDWGRSADYSCVAVLDVTNSELVALDRFNQIDYQTQLGRLTALYERFRPRAVVVEVNSMGQPLAEQLQRAGMPIVPFTTTNASKQVAVDALALAFERGALRILPDPILINELQAYEAERLPSGLIRYGAPEGMHDDTVMALMLAWHNPTPAVAEVTSYVQRNYTTAKRPRR